MKIHDSRIQRVDYVLESGVLKDMIVDDLFREGMTSYASCRSTCRRWVWRP